MSAPATTSTTDTIQPAKCVFIFGITGIQGSSVARELREAGVHVVGLTRNSESENAKKVAATGAKLVTGDMDRPETYEAALKDVDGVFLNLDFWQFYTGDGPAAAQKEVKQGKTVVDAIKRVGGKYIVFSALESLQPRQDLYHFEFKDDVKKYIQSLDLPATFLYTSYYYSNVLHALKVTPGGITLTKPMPDDTVIASFAAEQTGLWAKVAFQNPQQWIGKDMHATSENLTVKEYAAILESSLGKEVKTLGMSKEEFMNDVKTDRELEIERDVEKSRAIVPHAWDFAAWIKNTPPLHELVQKGCSEPTGQFGQSQKVTGQPESQAKSQAKSQTESQAQTEGQDKGQTDQKAETSTKSDTAQGSQSQQSTSQTKSANIPPAESQTEQAISAQTSQPMTQSSQPKPAGAAIPAPVSEFASSTK